MPRSAWLLVVAAVLVGASFLPIGTVPGIVLLTSAGTLFALVVLLRLVAAVAGRGARDALQQARSFARHDATPGFAVDLDGRVLFRNEAARERFGTRLAPTLTRALGGLFADPTAVIHRLQARAEEQGHGREDVVTRQGHVRVTVHAVRDGIFYWRFDEMEDRGAARGAETLSLPLMTVGRNGTILFMNEAARSMLGGRAKTLDAVVGGGRVESGRIVRLKGPEGPLPVRLVDIPGRSGRREIYLLPVDAPHTEAFSGDQIFDEMPVAMLKLGVDGEIRLANRQARDILGLSPEGQGNLGQLLEGLGRSVLDWLDDIVHQRAANTSEVLRVVRDDHETFAQVTLQRVMDDGAPALVAVLQDATRFKTLEEQFAQSQKMQAVGQLAGGIAHDFNNLLTAISGHCDLLLMRQDPSSPDYGDLMQIHQNANRAAGLVGQLLAFSRKQTLRPELLDLRETLADLTHLLNRLVGERVRINLVQDLQPATIRADRRQLEQVVMNLVVNARDAMPDGGEVRIETTRLELTDPLRRDRAVVPPGRYVLLRVTDKGTGIAPDKLSKIFEPFFTTKKPTEGTGLGLSTAYGIVKQSGGYIFVDSVVGSGTSFMVYFPERDEAVFAGKEVDEGAADAVPEQEPLVLDPTPAPQPAERVRLVEAATEPMVASEKGAAPKPTVADVGTDPLDVTLNTAPAGTSGEASGAGAEDTPQPAEGPQPQVISELSPELSDASQPMPSTPSELPDDTIARIGTLLAKDELRFRLPKKQAPSQPNGKADDLVQKLMDVDGNLPSEPHGAMPLRLTEPLPDALAAATHTAQSDAAPSGQGVVLLVEDEAPVRAFASRALRMRGFTVIEAGSAEEALEMLDDETLDVDVFVTDVVMPGMDGPSWVRKALRARPDTKVVFVSGYAEESFADTQARISNSVFLPKPFSLAELTETVRNQFI